MKGLLLAGGHGTRLRPLTFTGNKHMIPIANEPMVFYGLRHLAEGGISEVGIVLGPVHEGLEQAVGDGRSFGLRVTYIHQGEPKGLAHAVLCARDFLGDEPFVMYLGDNLLQDGIRAFVDRYNKGGADAVIGVTPVPNPRSYGVVEMDGDRIVSIEEKPPFPRGNLALIGVYLFAPKVHSIIGQLKPSRRGELEITDAIWKLHEAGGNVAVLRVRGWWKDTGRPEDLLEANARVLETRPPEWFGRSGEVAPGAEIIGRVRLEKGSFIGPEARVEGPTVVGEGVRIEGAARIGPGAALGDRARVYGSTVRRAIVMEGAEIHGAVEISDSIVGRSSQIHVETGGGMRLSCILGDSSKLRM
ncbi:MAG: glucose-1-phosphate thymidylyltransferase [Thermoplasmata archaeon]